MIKRIAELRAVMALDCEKLMEYVADGGNQDEVCALSLIEDYKAKKAELLELELQFEREYICR